jgi:hypothetical protein
VNSDSIGSASFEPQLPPLFCIKQSLSTLSLSLSFSLSFNPLQFDYDRPLSVQTDLLKFGLIQRCLIEVLLVLFVRAGSSNTFSHQNHRSPLDQLDPIDLLVN